ncbi:GyrI-like domain-containing protein [Lentzea sp. NPDC102401]|uniref:GyrI-like domain-containing protein n=1 Tax=Lentzea sp. NPDC102401 TaxID=3364128 RepID=UPI00380C900E
MPYAVQVKELQPSTALCLRMTAPADRVSEAVHRALAGLTDGADQVGLTASGPPEARYLSESGSGAVWIEASLPVASVARRTASGVVHRSGGKVAHVCHEGPYEDITDAYNALYTWIHRKGYEVAGHATEVYLTGPADTKQPGDYLTEIIVSVRQAP